MSQDISNESASSIDFQFSPPGSFTELVEENIVVPRKRERGQEPKQHLSSAKRQLVDVDSYIQTATIVSQNLTDVSSIVSAESGYLICLILLYGCLTITFL
ncbi:uncharacterized protein LOC127749080 [Frankliniella occidentalis]|uniref:Uncharacterized protein LOC127749080 n=1 Tax=Frankliniella occidentalis TaxID=133901 RepID=A0A9C6WMR3_FRAOC|nr:uncharacterized protein LOC127749080 [Frankliniella occidentalis]